MQAYAINTDSLYFWVLRNMGREPDGSTKGRSDKFWYAFRMVPFLFLKTPLPFGLECIRQYFLQMLNIGSKKGREK